MKTGIFVVTLKVNLIFLPQYPAITACMYDPEEWIDFDNRTKDVEFDNEMKNIIYQNLYFSKLAANG